MNDEYRTINTHVRERFGGYYISERVYDTDKDKATLFSHYWKADLKVRRLRNVWRKIGCSYWLRVIPADNKITTFHDKRVEKIGEWY